ncbi:hypothetical protein C7E18_20575, partial [Stenotrophomonas maltophilia]
HGIPVLLKDNINAAPMATSAGSLALQGFRPDDVYLVRPAARHPGTAEGQHQRGADGHQCRLSGPAGVPP